MKLRKRVAKFGSEDVPFLIDAVQRFYCSLALQELGEPDDEPKSLDADALHQRIRQLLTRIEGPDDFADVAELLAGSDKAIQGQLGLLIGSAGRTFAEDAVRNRALDELQLGLIAVALGYMVQSDWRDVMYCFAAISRAAELLDRDPMEDFLRAAGLVGSTQGNFGAADDWLLSFGGRSPENRALSAFGLVEEGSGASFRFRRLDELLTELVQVIAVHRSMTNDGTTVIVVSIERYTDGFVVLFRFEGDRRGSRGTLHFPWNQATDNDGRVYVRSARLVGPTMFGGNSAIHRGGVLFTPALAANVNRLRLELPIVESTAWIGTGSAGKSVTSKFAVGPWAFDITIALVG